MELSSPPPEPAAPPPRRSGCSFALVCIVLILAVLAGFIFYRSETAVRRTARGLADTLTEMFHLQPQVTLNERVVVQQATSVLELSVVTREVQVEREVANAWAGSTKRFKVRAVYRVRAGYNLQDHFQVQVNPGHVRVELPDPIVLGADQIDLEVTEHENGLWNKVQPQDDAEIVRILPGQARKQAVAAGILRDAAESTAKQLREKLGGEGVEVEIAPAAKAVHVIP